MPSSINYQVLHSSMLEKKLTVVKLTTIGLYPKKKLKKWRLCCNKRFQKHVLSWEDTLFLMKQDRMRKAALP